MEEKEMLEQTSETENVETQTTEENVEGIELTDTADDAESNAETAENNAEEETKEVKMFTQDEVNEIVKSRLARKERDYQKELSKFRDTDNVLRTTLNLKEGDDTNTKLREYYESEGIKLPEPIKAGLSSKDTERLGLGDAEDIIAEGYDAMVEEAERLAKIGYKNLNEREQVTFTKLAETLTNEKNKKELLKLGAKEDLLKDDDFNKFRKQFNSNVSIKDIYELYMSKQPKQKVENPGSMKNVKSAQPKTIFTDEDIAKMTDEELDANWDAIRKYQTSGNY